MPGKKNVKLKGQRTKAADKGKKGELVLARVFDAPRERVWKAWTEPAEVKRWWGPKGFTVPTCRIDLRVGGTYLYCMRSPEGKDYWGTGVYREIVRPRKLVATDSFADAKGRVVPATTYGLSGETPLEMLLTVTFQDVGGKTKLTLRHDGLPAGRDQEGAEQGWTESFERLAASLAEGSFEVGVLTDRRKRQVVMYRVFNAPRDRVFQAYTDPKLIPRWWGRRGQTTTVEAMDVRKGGRWRYVCRDPDGTEYGFRGEFREVRPPERIVSIFEFEGMPGHIVEDTATFEERDGKTKVTVTSRFETIEDLNGMLQSGMEEGAQETWDRLEELLGKTEVSEMTTKTKTIASTNVSRPKIILERTLRASVEDVWEAWTTKKGLEAWWGPQGFTTSVRKLDLRPGGKFEYAMTATSPEAIEAMKSAGLDLTSVAGGTYNEVTPRRRLVYTTLADFIPGVTPYEVVAVIELHPTAGGVRLVVTEDAMHDDLWTERSTMGMDSSLDRLVKFLDARSGRRQTTR